MTSAHDTINDSKGLQQIIELKDLREDGPGLFYHLTDPQLRSRQEPEKGVLIAEGPKVIHTALDAGLTPLSLLIRKSFIDKEIGRNIIARCCGAPVYTAEDGVLEELTGFRLQRSWALCALRRPPERSPEEVLSKARRVAVLEGITEPSNLGAIFRSAAALGADGLLLSPECCDPFHRRAVRVCMGSVFTVPWARTGQDHGFGLLEKNSFYTVGLALRADALPLDHPALRGKERLALFLGTEDTGLREETIARCRATALIPMRPGIDSLNVAAAAAVAFWELF